MPAAIQKLVVESSDDEASSSGEVCDELDECTTQIVEEDPVPRPPAIVLNPGYTGPQLLIDPVYLESPASLLKRARLFSPP